jgi:uncharacterized protein (DUF697 family)
MTNNAQQQANTNEPHAKDRKRTASVDGITQEIVQRALRAVDGANEADAQARVEELRVNHPEMPRKRLATMLVQKKCIQAGTLGAATSGAAIIPGWGTLEAVTVGAVADLSLTIKLQVELVLELAALYDYTFAPQEKHHALLLVAGIGAGTERLLVRGGIEAAEQFAERFVGRALVKAVPVLGVGLSASLNALITYLVGQRAQAYFQLGPEAVGDWGASLRAITGVDERVLARQLSETASTSWRALRTGTESMGERLHIAAQTGTIRIRKLMRRSGDRSCGTNADAEVEAMEIPVLNLTAESDWAADAL